MDHMTRYYSNSEECFRGNASVGDVFAASFEHDAKWYRVCVTSVTSVTSDGVEVLYIDYGDYAIVCNYQSYAHSGL